jgi:hypothetical protein
MTRYAPEALSRTKSLADALFLAGVFAQVGFLGHDAGHS